MQLTGYIWKLSTCDSLSANIFTVLFLILRLMWKTSLKTTVSQPFTFKFNTFIHRHFDHCPFVADSLFSEFLVKYNHRIQGKKVVRMSITEEFVKHLMEQNAASLYTSLIVILYVFFGTKFHFIHPWFQLFWRGK